MKLLGKAIVFGVLAEGTYFSLSAELDDREYLNIKVKPALLVGDTVGVPFNAIALKDGRPRTFDDNQKVYAYEKNKVLK